MMIRKTLVVLCMLFSFFSAGAQRSDTKKQKTEAQKKAKDFADFQKYFENLLHTDWAWISRYKDADSVLPAPDAGEK